MTDDEFRAKLRRLAERLDVDVPDRPNVDSTRRQDHRRLSMFTAAATTVVLLTGAILWIGGGDDQLRTSVATLSAIRSETTQPTTTDQVAPVTTDQTPETVATEPVPSTSVEPMVPAEPELTRPVFDLEGCTRTWARSSEGGTLIENPFARWSSLPIAFQLIGDPSGSLTKPFAMIERIFADQRTGTGGGIGRSDTKINGNPTEILGFSTPNSGGSVAWILPDGTEAYLRTRSLTRDQMIELARAVIPRASETGVPGFDLPADPPFGLSILDESHGGFDSGPGASSECRFAEGGWFTVGVSDSRPLTEAVWILDRPSEFPLLVQELDDGRMLLVYGRPDVAGLIDAAAASVRQATDAEWSAMVYEPRSGELFQSNFPVDQELIDSLAGSTFTSSDQFREAVLSLLEERLGVDEERGEIYSSTELGLSGFVITVPVSGRAYIAEQWSVQVGGSEGDPTIFSIRHGIKCADGNVHPPDYTGC